MRRRLCMVNRDELRKSIQAQIGAFSLLLQPNHSPLHNFKPDLVLQDVCRICGWIQIGSSRRDLVVKIKELFEQSLLLIDTGTEEDVTFVSGKLTQFLDEIKQLTRDPN